LNIYANNITSNISISVIPPPPPPLPPAASLSASTITASQLDAKIISIDNRPVSDIRDLPEPKQRKIDDVALGAPLWIYDKELSWISGKVIEVKKADEKLKVLFDGKKQISMFDLAKVVNKNVK
jgi:hypothetical protein